MMTGTSACLFPAAESLFVFKRSLSLLENVYPQLLCLKIVGAFLSVLLAPSLLSTRWCWFFPASAWTPAVSGGACLESLEREFILSEKTTYSILFVSPQSKSASKSPLTMFLPSLRSQYCAL